MAPTTVDGLDIDDATIDGTEVSEITVDGNVVFKAGPDIPDSVTDQFTAQSFAKPWPNEIPDSNSMSVEGLSEDPDWIDNNPGVEGDGVDDFGYSDLQFDPAATEAWSVALTIETEDSGRPMGEINVGGDDFIFIVDLDTRAAGEMAFRWRSNNDEIVIGTNEQVDDGEVHAIVINKRSDSADDIEIYVDDMSNNLAIVDTDESPDSGSYAEDPSDIGFFAVNERGSGSSFTQCTCGSFEFNSEPFTEQERNGFVSRRPEVS